MMTPNVGTEGRASAPAQEAEYEADADQSLAVAISEALAAAEGADPWEIDPLHEAIDVDAVERLFEAGDGTGTMSLSFPVDGWNVHVYGDGSIEVYEARRPTGSAAGVGNVVGD